MSNLLTEATKFSIFKAENARPEDGIPIMQYHPPSTVVAEGSTLLQAAGIEKGHENRLLFSMPGFSLTYVWFKSGYPLPRHSHNADCLYYIVAGSLGIGNEQLAAGDGFFVGADVPYTYTPGAEGAEVLEFRAANEFDIKVLAENPAFWQRALTTVTSKHEDWLTESKPSAK